jgi:hypothetical protein
MAEDAGLAGVEGNQPGQEPQQRSLPGAVRSRQQHDLATGGVEIDTGQRREAPQEADGRTETDDDRHTRPRAIDVDESTETTGKRSNRRCVGARRGR